MSGTTQPIAPRRVPDLPNRGTVTAQARFVVDTPAGVGLHDTPSIKQFLTGTLEQTVATLSERVTALQNQVQGQVGWIRLSRTHLTAATSAVHLALPAGHAEYRVTFEGVNGLTGAGLLQMRVSQDGANFNAGQVYGGVYTDTDGHTVDPHTMSGLIASELAGEHLNTPNGVVGECTFNSGRTAHFFHSQFSNPDGPRHYFRSGAVEHPPANFVAIFLSANSIQMSPGARFDVLARV